MDYYTYRSIKYNGKYKTTKVRWKNKKVKKELAAPKKYHEYIKSKYWLKRKNKYWQYHGRQCCVCGSLHIVQLHHGKYSWQVFGNEPDNCLFPLCKDCHNMLHEIYGVKSNMINETLKFIEDNYIPHESILK